MKSISSGLQTHYASDTTTVATLWKVTRLDGEIFGFTDFDKDITFGGLIYRAESGFSSSQLAAQSGLSVNNVEFDGFFDSAYITQADLEAGVWDGATVIISNVNYLDLTQGAEVMMTGELGQFTSRDGLYVAELRGLADRLTRIVTKLYLPSCDADLGDARCMVDIEALRVAGEVTAVASRLQFTTDLSTVGDDFTFGVLTWTTGDNTGRLMEVKQHVLATGVVSLQLPMVQTVSVGDEFTIVPGCGKSLEECRDRYSNVINFRGYPHIPGLDRMIRPGGV